MFRDTGFVNDTRRCFGLGVAIAGLLLGAAHAAAEEVRLKDGTRLSATVLGKDGERVVIALPRAEVAAVDGQALPPPVTTGTPAPTFRGVDLAGVTHTLQDYRGHVVILKFWASWCPYCRSDIPLMKDLTLRYQDEGVQVLTVSVDQDLDKLRALTEQEQLPYPVIPLASQPDDQQNLPERYETRGIPAYYLIGADGVITHTFSGSLSRDPKAIEQAIDRLLSASSGS